MQTIRMPPLQAHCLPGDPAVFDLPRLALDRQVIPIKGLFQRFVARGEAP